MSFAAQVAFGRMASLAEEFGSEGLFSKTETSKDDCNNTVTSPHRSGCCQLALSQGPSSPSNKPCDKL